MIYIECMRHDPEKRRITAKMTKEFICTLDFQYFYKTAKLDGWDFINVSMYNPDTNPLLSSERDLVLLRSKNA